MKRSKKLALLRGVTPVGKNKIPKMAYLREILTEVGLESVQTYIQSGNVICETNVMDRELSQLIHETIEQKIGADLDVIIKYPSQFLQAVLENPFDSSFDQSRVHLVFTNQDIDERKLSNLLSRDFGEEVLKVGTECLYMYLPREAEKKRLNTNFLEKQLGIRATMRKLSVISRLSEM